MSRGFRVLLSAAWIEDQFRLGHVSDVPDAIVHAVETRYDLAERAPAAVNPAAAPGPA